MTNAQSAPLITGLSINRSARTPIREQLFEGLVTLIHDGVLLAGQRIPSSRATAKDLGISRVTVVDVFEQLIAEGYLESFGRRGTYVAKQSPEEFTQAPRPAWPELVEAEIKHPDLALRSGYNRLPRLEGSRLFNPAIPGIDEFPRRTWERLRQTLAAQNRIDDLAYAPVNGVEELREAIAAYVRTARAVNCDADQVIVVSGAHQAIALACFVLLNPGETALCEDPCHNNARVAITSQQVNLVPVPVDDQGIDISLGEAKAPDARLAYAKPARNYPLGTTMSDQRRQQVLEWAKRNDGWIVEDDYDGEFWYSGTPAPALQSIDYAERVIYIGTFSKTLFPALGMNYMVVPKHLVDVFAHARYAISRPAPIDTQRVVAEFMTSGHFSRHVRRMRGIYTDRMWKMHDIFQTRADGMIAVEPVNSGHHFIGCLPKGCDEKTAWQAATRRGFMPRPLLDYRQEIDLPAALVIGFACVPPNEMVSATDGLVAAISESRTSH